MHAASVLIRDDAVQLAADPVRADDVHVVRVGIHCVLRIDAADHVHVQIGNALRKRNDRMLTYQPDPSSPFSSPVKQIHAIVRFGFCFDSEKASAIAMTPEVPLALSSAPWYMPLSERRGDRSAT